MVSKDLTSFDNGRVRPAVVDFGHSLSHILGYGDSQHAQRPLQLGAKITGHP